jgi:hypothetical protein
MERAFNEVSVYLFWSGPSLYIYVNRCRMFLGAEVPTLGVRNIKTGHLGFVKGFPSRAAF